MGDFPLHMAMAALAGASVAAFSSYYLHCRALAQLLEFALDVERRRGGGETDSSSGGVRQLNLRKEKQRRGVAIPGRRRRKVAGKRGSVGEGGNEVVDEKDGDIVRKERGLSRIESLPGGCRQKSHHDICEPVLFLSTHRYSPESRQGGRPETISDTVHPKAQISAASSYSFLAANFGAKYIGVPLISMWDSSAAVNIFEEYVVGEIVAAAGRITGYVVTKECKFGSQTHYFFYLVVCHLAWPWIGFVLQSLHSTATT